MVSKPHFKYIAVVKKKNILVEPLAISAFSISFLISVLSRVLFKVILLNLLYKLHLQRSASDCNKRTMFFRNTFAWNIILEQL